MDSNSKRPSETVEESTKRQKIKYVKQIITNNINKYINNPESKLKTADDIHNFANYLVTKTHFYLGTDPKNLKN